MRALVMMCLLTPLSMLAGDVRIAATNVSHSQTEKASQVRTQFEVEAELNPREVTEVISLAGLCGLSQPSEVRTFYFLPGGGRGVAVKSLERTNGADITFDEITIGKDGWTDFGAKRAGKRVGSFWANPSSKFTTHLRVYDFRGERIRVRIGDGVTTGLSDKVIDLIATKKVRFPSGDLDFQRREMEEMLRLKPSLLLKQDGKLWLHFVDRLDALQFHFEKGELTLEAVIYISI